MTTLDDPADGLDTREAGQSGCRYHGSRRGRGDGHRPQAECVPVLRPLGAGVIVVYSVRPGLTALSCSSTPGRCLRPAAAARGLSQCTGYEYDAASSRLCLERDRRQSQHERDRRPANGGHCHYEPLHPSLRWRGAGTGLIRLSPGVRPVWRVDLVAGRRSGGHVRPLFFLRRRHSSYGGPRAAATGIGDRGGHLHLVCRADCPVRREASPVACAGSPSVASMRDSRGLSLPLCGVFVHSAPWSMHRDIAVRRQQGRAGPSGDGHAPAGRRTPSRPVRSVVGIGRPQAA